MLFSKKLNLKNMNFYIIFFISLSIFGYIFCQEKVGDSDFTRNLEGELKVGEYEEGVNPYPYPDQYNDNFGFIACHFDPHILNKDCFDNIIMFNQRKYLLNNFAANKNGDILIQYNEYNNFDEEYSSRLFYGLAKNGSYFFANESSYTREFNIKIEEEFLENSDFLNLYKIQDSKSLFVSIKNINKKNQYLFSINSYDSMVELYDLNNNDNNYFVWSFNKFFNLDEEDYYFPFEFELFELKDKSEYIIAFIPFSIVEEYILDVSFIKKFRFKSFDKDTYEELSSINYEDYFNCIIINTFLLEESKTLGILSINETVIDNEIPNDRASLEINEPIGEGNYATLNRRIQSKTGNYPPFSIIKFNLKFYDQKLKSLLGSREVTLMNQLAYSYHGEDLFIKSLYLNILNKQFVVFLYNIYNPEDKYYYFIFDLFEINILDYRNMENIIYPAKYGYIKQDIIDLNLKNIANDFIKINDAKVVFIYMDEAHNNELVIIIINVNLIGKYLDSIDFTIDLEDYTPSQIKGFAYNGYLLFSSTIKEENYYEKSNNYLSIFMAFGYFNGTDNEIDITKYLNKKALDVKDSFIYFLYDNLKIENNIFGYVPLSALKFVSFPKELSLYIYDKQNGEEIELSENSFNPGELQQILNPYFVSDHLIIDSYCVFVNHFVDYDNFDCQNDHDFIIKENTTLIKSSEYYYIDYQSFVVDNYMGFDQEGPSAELKNRRLSQKRNLALIDIYPGRINRVKFKLCHEYCETCYELSTSNNEQKCESCLPKYQYDYLYFLNKPKKIQIIFVFLRENIMIYIIKNYLTAQEVLNIMLIQQIIKKFVFQMMMNIHVHLPIQFIIKHPKNVFIVILSVLKMVNVLQII